MGFLRRGKHQPSIGNGVPGWKGRAGDRAGALKARGGYRPRRQRRAPEAPTGGRWKQVQCGRGAGVVSAPPSGATEQRRKCSPIAGGAMAAAAGCGAQGCETVRAGVLREPAMVLSGGGLPQSPGTECRMPVDGAGTQQFRNGLALQRQVEIVVAAGSLREARIEIELAVLDFLLDDLLGGVRVEFSLREQFFRQGMLRHGARRQDVAGYGAEV